MGARLEFFILPRHFQFSGPFKLQSPIARMDCCAGPGLTDGRARYCLQEGPLFPLQLTFSSSPVMWSHFLFDSH